MKTLLSKTPTEDYRVDMLRETLVYKANLLKCKEPVKKESVKLRSPEFYWLLSETLKPNA